MRAAPLLLLLLLTGRGLASDSVSTRTLSIEILRSRAAVPDRIVEEMTVEVTREVRERRCFHVVEAAQGGDLALRVVLGEVIEETSYETGIADRTVSQEPDAARAYTAVFDMDYEVELRSRADDALLRSKRLHAGDSRRPTLPGEDTASIVRSESLAHAARDIRAFACSAAKKLEKGAARTP